MVTTSHGQGIDGVEDEDGWVLGRYVQDLMSERSLTCKELEDRLHGKKMHCVERPDERSITKIMATPLH